MSTIQLLPMASLRDPSEFREREWLWHGYLARQSITLLTSLWKAGKTTLLSVLLSRMRHGGVLAGLPVTPSRAVVVTEEPESLWQLRHQQLPLSPHVGFHFRPFEGLPTMADWEELIAAILRDQREARLDLAVIDTLGVFLPAGAEGQRDCMMRAMLPLRRLTAAGMSVLLMHHPRKGRPALGEAARGAGALCGFVDIVLEMKALTHADLTDRRRRLVAFSRFPQTPNEMILELNEAGNDYVARPPSAFDCSHRDWPTAAAILRQAGGALTRSEICDRWPSPDPPNRVSLWRCLEWAVAAGLVLKEQSPAEKRAFAYRLA